MTVTKVVTNFTWCCLDVDELGGLSVPDQPVEWNAPGSEKNGRHYGTWLTFHWTELSLPTFNLLIEELVGQYYHRHTPNQSQKSSLEFMKVFRGCNVAPETLSHGCRRITAATDTSNLKRVLASTAGHLPHLKKSVRVSGDLS